MIKRRCIKCKKIFYTFPSRIVSKYGHASKFCSKKCYSEIRDKELIKKGKKTRFKKGHIPFSKLYPKLMPCGSQVHNWKGNNVGYRGLHYWLHRIKGTPKKCEICNVRKTTPKSIHWANINNHKYSRNPEDYIGMCCSCHKLFDLKCIS